MCVVCVCVCVCMCVRALCFSALPSSRVKFCCMLEFCTVVASGHTQEYTRTHTEAQHLTLSTTQITSCLDVLSLFVLTFSEWLSLSVSPSVSLFVAQIFDCLPACLSICLFICISVCLPVCPSLGLSVCLSVCMDTNFIYFRLQPSHTMQTCNYATIRNTSTNDALSSQHNSQNV